MYDYFKEGLWHGIAYWIYDFQTLVTGLAAVLAAFLSIRYVRKQISQVEEHRREDIESNKKAVLQSFAFKALSIIDSIERNKRHIDKLKAVNPEVTYEDLWSIFRPVLGDKLPLERLTSEDIFVLSKIKNPDLAQEAQNLERANSTIANMIDEHSKLMMKHSNLAAKFTKYTHDGSSIVGVSRFDPNANPEIMNCILELSELVKNIDKYVNESSVKGKLLIKDINEMFKVQEIKLKFV